MTFVQRAEPKLDPEQQQKIFNGPVGVERFKRVA